MRFINVIVFPVFLVLASLFVKSSSGICRDKFALNSVDAVVHIKRHSRGQIEKGKDINMFDGYSMIDIVRSNVTQLCEGKLVSLSLIVIIIIITVTRNDKEFSDTTNIVTD